jgi:hypothetical protein
MMDLSFALLVRVRVDEHADAAQIAIELKRRIEIGPALAPEIIKRIAVARVDLVDDGR